MFLDKQLDEGILHINVVVSMDRDFSIGRHNDDHLFPCGELVSYNHMHFELAESHPSFSRRIFELVSSCWIESGRVGENGLRLTKGDINPSQVNKYDIEFGFVIFS